MRTVAAIVLLSTLLSTLSAQVPVKKDLMQMLEKVPSPPKTVKDAFAKMVISNDYGVLKCRAEKLFQFIDQEVKGVETEFAAQPKADPNSIAPGL
jgi:hypothetical protein